MLIYLWILLCSLFLGIPSIYYLYMKRVAKRPWKLTVNSQEWLPSISILVPTYNEENTIKYKVENLSLLKYPKDLLQIIIIDSASTDNTINEIKNSIVKNKEISVKVIEETKREGKAAALNKALPYATGEIIIVSDADCFWPQDILHTALPYLSDPEIGAIAGEEKILNLDQSWVTRNEKVYRDKMLMIRLGESKVYSTIRFEGGFGAYKRFFLGGFDCETGADDSGTALNVVQKGARTIIVPEVNFFTWFPITLNEKIIVKYRRASQLVNIWIKCLRLLMKNQLELPKLIAIPEIFLHVFNPIIFILVIFSTVNLLFIYPPLLIVFAVLLVVPSTRPYLMETLQNNSIVFLALLGLISRKKFIMWRKAESSRIIVSPILLREEGLIL